MLLAYLSVTFKSYRLPAELTDPSGPYFSLIIVQYITLTLIH